MKVAALALLVCLATVVVASASGVDAKRLDATKDASAGRKQRSCMYPVGPDGAAALCKSGWYSQARRTYDGA